MAALRAVECHDPAPSAWRIFPDPSLHPRVNCHGQAVGGCPPAAGCPGRFDGHGLSLLDPTD